MDASRPVFLQICRKTGRAATLKKKKPNSDNPIKVTKQSLTFYSEIVVDNLSCE